MKAFLVAVMMAGSARAGLVVDGREWPPPDFATGAQGEKAETAWQNPAGAEDFLWSVSGFQAVITGYVGTAAAVEIPALLDGALVTKIGDKAFLGATNVVSVAGGPNLLSLGSQAFRACSGLERVDLPSVRYIGPSAFLASGLREAVFPNVTSMWTSVFRDCASLTNAELASVESIAKSAFENCPALVSVKFSLPPPQLVGGGIYSGSDSVTNYVLRGVSGWGAEFCGRPVVRWPALRPVFLLKLSGNWTDFEIKASTNNFGGPQSLVYYYKSWAAEQHATNPDPGAEVYFTDDCSADPRVWRRKPADAAVSSALASSGSVVRAACFVPTAADGSLWMYADNAGLVWSYMRVDDFGYEKNFDGSQTRWTAVRPVSWEAGDGLAIVE